MTDTQRRNIRLSAAFIIAAAMALYAAERQGLLTSTRLVAHNLLAPGRLAVLSISGWRNTPPNSISQSSDVTSAELAELQQLLLNNELQRRQLLIENARLAQRLKQQNQLAPVESYVQDDLLEFEGRTATILNHSGMSGPLLDLVVDAGESAGLRKSELVVATPGLVLDMGAEENVASGQHVASGVAVVGRIAEVSQWVSLVRPITDPEFSAAVQIVKRTVHGGAFGAGGMLVGTGEATCRVTGIPYTEAVAVGDEVFSADVNGINGPRLYYGRIVTADYSSGGEWTIVVEPAVRPRELSEVTIIQPRVNPERVNDRRNREDRHQTDGASE